MCPGPRQVTRHGLLVPVADRLMALVGHESPVAELGALVLASTRSTAGATGIGSSCAPPDGAIASGRSVGANAERCTESE